MKLIENGRGKHPVMLREDRGAVNGAL
jgi:hypothetical protein